MDEALKGHGLSIVVEKDHLVIKVHTILLQKLFQNLVFAT